MAFSVNSSLTHIPFDDATLAEIYRSAAAQIVSFVSPRPCEAFIATFRSPGDCHVYIGFLDTITKKVHVFVSDSPAPGADNHDRQLREAKYFLEGLGYAVDKVNIDFSPGIRQVVIRDLRILHPPAQRPKSRMSRGEEKTEKASPRPTDTTAAVEPAVPTAVAAAAAGAGLIAATPGSEKSNDDCRSVSRLAETIEKKEREILDIAEELVCARKEAAANQSKLKAAHDAAAAELAAARLELLQARQQAATDVAALRQELQRAEATFAETLTEQEKRFRLMLDQRGEEALHAAEEKNRLRERLTAETADLRGEILSLAEQLADSEARHEEEKARLVAECRDARMEADRLTGHLHLVEKVVSEAQASATASAESAVEAVAYAETEAALLRKTAADREAEQTSIIADLQARLQAESIRAREAEQTLAHLQDDYRRLTLERPTLLSAARKTKRLQDELRRLNGRLEKAESAPVPTREYEPAEPLVPVAGEAMIEVALAATAVSSLAPEAIDQSTEPDLTTAEELLTTTGDLRVNNEVSPDGMPSWEEAFSALMAEGGGFAPAEFGGTGIDFLVDPTVQHVDVDSADDIIALYESMNEVQAMPDGRGLKRCSAYICVVNGENGPRVFNVWSLVEERRMLVALPSHKETQDSWEGIIKDALFYFESIGFIMEPCDVTSNRQKNKALAKLPVLRKRGAGAIVSGFQATAGSTEPMEPLAVGVK